MPITPKKISILAALETQLETAIDGTGSYLTTVGTVTRNLKTFAQLTPQEMPSIIIEIGDTNYTPMTAEEYTTGGDIQSVTDAWEIILNGYVSSNNDTADEAILQDDLLNFECDIIRAVFSDKTIGGTALDIELLKSEIIPDINELLGCVRVYFAVKFDFYPATNP